jgi:hypothetical protein
MSEKLYLIVVDWEISGTNRDKLQSCQYVRLQPLTPIDLKFCKDHDLWRALTYAVSATEADMLLFRLDSRFKNCRVFPYPENPIDE